MKTDHDDLAVAPATSRAGGFVKNTTHEVGSMRLKKSAISPDAKLVALAAQIPAAWFKSLDDYGAADELCGEGKDAADAWQRANASKARLFALAHRVHKMQARTADGWLAKVKALAEIYREDPGQINDLVDTKYPIEGLAGSIVRDLVSLLVWSGPSATPDEAVATISAAIADRDAKRPKQDISVAAAA